MSKDEQPAVTSSTGEFKVRGTRGTSLPGSIFQSIPSRGAERSSWSPPARSKS